MRKGLGAVAVGLGLTLGSLGMAGAQIAPEACGEIDEETCAILAEAFTTPPMQASFAAAIEITIDGIRDVPEYVNLYMDGSFDASDVPQIDFSGMDSGEIEASLNEAIAAFSGRLNFTLELPPDYRRQFRFLDDPTINMALVDGVGYIDFKALGQSLGDSTLNGWYGMEFDQVWELMRLSDPASTDSLFEALTMPAQNTTLNDPELSEYTTLEQVESDQAGILAFEYIIDTEALAESDAFEDALSTQFELQDSLQNLTRSERAVITRLFLLAIEDSTIEVRYEVDEARRLLTRAYLRVVLEGSTLDILIGGLGIANETPGFEMVIDMTYRDFDDIPSIVAPRSAEIIDLRDLLGDFGTTPT